MADIELIIKIPEEQYNMILLSDKTAISECVSKEAMMYAIKNGTPLLKGHRKYRLVSEDILKENLINFDFSSQTWISVVGLSDATVGFIETNKEEI